MESEGKLQQMNENNNVVGSSTLELNDEPMNC
jgi:hypothetical protein